jgi:anti-anti-sigma regulatory factor
MNDETHVAANTDGGEEAPGRAHGALTLPPMLDLPYAKTLREMLLAHLTIGDLSLDAEAVEWLSTPCAQVLLATGRAATSAGARFLINGPSEALRRALSDFGLDGEFRQWMN